MERFTAYQLRFLCEATTSIEMPYFKGSMLRGAFFDALRRDFCLDKASTSCRNCSLHPTCPICRLVATVDNKGHRGADMSRPFTMEPIIAPTTHYADHDAFEFGITLLGDSFTLFPYVILAVKKMGEDGIGSHSSTKGRFLLQEAWAENPVTGDRNRLYHRDTELVKVPGIPVTHRQVKDYSARLPDDHIKLRLLTPLHLINNRELVKQLTFQVFMQRLLRRLTDLYLHCCNSELDLDFASLPREAGDVTVTKDSIKWVDLSSSSSQKRHIPTSGLVGEIGFAGHLQPFLPYLVWGQLTHVGKDATKGNGWYQIVES